MSDLVTWNSQENLKLESQCRYFQCSNVKKEKTEDGRWEGLRRGEGEYEDGSEEGQDGIQVKGKQQHFEKKNMFLDMYLYSRRTGTSRRRLIMSSFCKRLRVSFILAVFVFFLTFSQYTLNEHNAKKIFVQSQHRSTDILGQEILYHRYS